MKPVTLFIFQSPDGHKCAIAATAWGIAVAKMSELSALKCELVGSETITSLNRMSLLYSIIFRQAQSRAVVIDNQILPF